jgi:hypothetical protein
LSPPFQVTEFWHRVGKVPIEHVLDPSIVITTLLASRRLKSIDPPANELLAQTLIT